MCAGVLKHVLMLHTCQVLCFAVQVQRDIPILYAFGIEVDWHLLPGVVALQLYTRRSPCPI